MMRTMAAALILSLSLASSAGETNIIDGHVWVCTDDGICMDMGPVEESAALAAAPDETDSVASGNPSKPENPPRLAQGYLKPDAMIAFLEGKDAASAANGFFAFVPVWMALLIVLAGGVSMNLTPCVLPVVPVNLMIIGRSALRGLLYGLGLALAYGLLGVFAALFGLSFGSIQGSPWFNAAVCAVFILLALALCGVFSIDLSRRRGSVSKLRASLWPGFFAFVAGVASAVLAGACVAPVLVAVLAQSALLASEGRVVAAVTLPFVLGVGMALPWPFAGAGLKILPRPGKWMGAVNRIFALAVLLLAAYYGYLAWSGFARAGRSSEHSGEGTIAATPATIDAILESSGRPVFVDCWAKWCKNCLAMEESTFRDAKVLESLSRFTVVKLEVTDDIDELRKIPGFEGIVGLPAFLVFGNAPAGDGSVSE